MDRPKRIRQLLLAKAKEEYSKRVNESENNNMIAPYSPSPLVMCSQVIAKLKLTSEDVVYDLGCGDGRWLFEAVKQSQCHAIGIEMDETLVHQIHTQIEALDKDINPSRLQVECGDVWSMRIQSQATVIIIYAFMASLRRLKDTIFRQLNPGTRILSVGVSGLLSRVRLRCILMML